MLEALARMPSGMLAAGLLTALLALPGSSNADCRACAVAERDCQGVVQREVRSCRTRCRDLEPLQRDACRARCRQAREQALNGCARMTQGCEQSCRSAADPSCAEACLDPMRECGAQARRTRSTCLRTCRSQAAEQRGICQAGPAEQVRDCLVRTAKAQRACGLTCQEGVTSAATRCRSSLLDCVRGCSGG